MDPMEQHLFEVLGVAVLVFSAGSPLVASLVRILRRRSTLKMILVYTFLHLLNRDKMSRIMKTMS
jgi:hypothetical protein